MLQGKYIVKSNVKIASRTFRLEVLGDTSAMQRAGQFVNVELDGFYLRRPLAVTCWDSGGFSVIYKVVGEGTARMTSLESGQSLDILTGLGNGFDTAGCRRKALIVCGGVGASPAFTLARQLLESGRGVNVILGFNTSSEVVLAEEYRALGARVEVTTLDGSEGTGGLVTAVLPEMAQRCDYVYVCGPKVMMKAVCDALPDMDGEVSLEERMGCGCGICYGCTCHTSDGPRRVCADGPVFDKKTIIW